MRISTLTAVALAAAAAGSCGGDPEGLGAPDGEVVQTGALVDATVTHARPEIGRVEVRPRSISAVVGCTGTVIGSAYVLTSAHCLMDYGSAEFIVDNLDGSETRNRVEDYRLLGVRQVTASINVYTPDGFVADLAILKIEGVFWGIPAVPIADRLPVNGDWSTRFGYGESSRNGGGGDVKRWRSFRGLTSDFAAHGDSGGPALFGYGEGATPIWGVVSKIKRDLLSTSDWDANATAFKLQIEGTLRNWSLRGYDESIDRPGCDYATAPAALAADCESRCIRDGARCVAWSFSDGTCFLKEVVPNWVPRWYRTSVGTSGLNPNRDGSGRVPNAGWDLAGPDYATRTLGAHADCATACSRDARCRAATSEPPGAAGVVCHFKDFVPPPYPRSGWRAIIKRGLEMDTDRWGSDLRSFDIPEHAPEKCQAQCAAETGCRAWSFAIPKTGVPGRCYLKNAVPATTPKLGIISGRRDFEYY